MSWGFFIWVIHEILDTYQQLRDGKRWSPVFVFIKYWETYCARWINVWVKKYWREFAFWRFIWIVFRKFHHQFVNTSFPRWSWLSWNFTFPLEKILSFTICWCNRFCSESKILFNIIWIKLTRRGALFSNFCALALIFILQYSFWVFNNKWFIKN